MRIDATHRPWITATLVLLAAASLAYVFYARNSVAGPSGGSRAGILYGAAGYGLMIYAALLGVRKKFPIWRVGRAQTWMRGHLWLGSLSYFLILFHSGFAARGQLTLVLMILLTIVFLSGVVGAVAQHFLPKLITSMVPMETIYEQIASVRRQLCDEADRLVEPVLGRADARKLVTDSSALIARESGQHRRFVEIYHHTIRPFLADPERVRNECADREASTALFATMRGYLPPAVHPILADLENICEEQRQLKLQRRLYLTLHAWLVVHVPLSIAVLALGGVHACLALRY